jgi:hypothetical protein
MLVLKYLFTFFKVGCSIQKSLGVNIPDDKKANDTNPNGKMSNSNIPNVIVLNNTVSKESLRR